MKKTLNNWKAVLLVSAIICFSILLLTLVRDFYELPSEGFSKEVHLRSYEKENSYDAYAYKNFVSEGYEDSIVMVLNDGDDLMLERYTATGELIESKVLLSGIGQVMDISSSLQGDVLKVVYRTDEEIQHIEYDLNSDELITERSIAQGPDSAVLKGDTVVYSIDGNYYYNDDADHFLFETSDIAFFDYDVQGTQLYLTTLSSHLGSHFTELYEINLVDGTLDKTRIKKFTTAATTKPTEHHMIMNGDKVLTMNVFRDDKSKVTQYFEVGYDMVSGDHFHKSDFTLGNYPNFKYLSFSDDGIEALIEVYTFVGKDELASAGNTYSNLLLYRQTPEGMENAALTKMKNGHPNYDYFTMSNETYLVFNTVKGERGDLYLASTHPEVIAASNTLGVGGFMNLLLGALTILPVAFGIYLLTCWGQILPVIFTVLPFSMIKLTWVEKHQKEMLIASVGIFTVSTFYSFYSSIGLLQEKIGGIAGMLPWHLNSIANMTLALTLTLAISMVVLYLYCKKNNHHNFIVKFLVMFVSQSTLYALLFQTYPLLVK